MKTRMAVMAGLLWCSMAMAQSGPVEIKLNHLLLRWTAAGGLAVNCDGRPMLNDNSSPLTAYPTGWAWGHGLLNATRTAEVEKRGQQTILRVITTDEKLWLKQVVTAGPGDRFTIANWFVQSEWDEAINYQLCLCKPATPWFVGANYTTTTNGTVSSGAIPLRYAGNAHPFADVDQVVFDALQGRLTVRASQPMTIFDYAHRETLWLGRDAVFPRGFEQQLSAEFSYEPVPFVVGGLQMDQLSVPASVKREELTVGLRLARTVTGPRAAAVRLVAEGDGSGASDEQQVTLGETPARLALRIPLPGPGTHSAHLEVLADGKEVYRTTAFTTTVPRLLTIMPGRLPYAVGEKATVLADVSAEAGGGLRLSVEGPGGRLAQVEAAPGRRTEASISLSGLPLGTSVLTATLTDRSGVKVGSATCNLVIAEPVRNPVVVDHRTQSLVVGGLPFCPQACYADIQSVERVVEAEAPLGFNVVSPYLPNDPALRRASREAIRKVMDRCAEVGIYVQLGMLFASRAPQDEAKWELVREEVEAFRDHPALLTYYLADEPELGWSKPEECAEAYRRIKALDPWHPITMVFCQAGAAGRYLDGMDIVMTDPYPIPNGPVTTVTGFCRRIRADMGDTLPLWLVPQAFGGGEWWQREPSRQEERVMTYLGLIGGAHGIQYFVRRPVVGSPTSPDLWSECRRLMLELSQLTPALTSPEPQPQVTASQTEVSAAAYAERGAVTILAANVTNRPLPLTLAVAGSRWSGEAEVLFENRTVKVTEGKLSDTIEGMGTRAYRLQVGRPPADLAQPDKANLTVNPSFEEAHNVGTPDGSYVSQGADMAASWFVDPRLGVHGRQSLRLRAPADGKSVTVMPFPVTLEPGTRYRVSVWARGERDGQRFSLSLDTLEGEAAEHAMTTDWREYTAEFTASADTDGRLRPNLRLLSAGSAWFDLLQVVPLG